MMSELQIARQGQTEAFTVLLLEQDTRQPLDGGLCGVTPGRLGCADASESTLSLSLCSRQLPLQFPHRESVQTCQHRE